MQSEARHLQEIAQRKAMEEKMAQVSFIPVASAAVDNRVILQQMNTMSEQDALVALQNLQKVEAKQKKEIKRLYKQWSHTNYSLCAGWSMS